MHRMSVAASTRPNSGSLATSKVCLTMTDQRRPQLAEPRSPLPTISRLEPVPRCQSCGRADHSCSLAFQVALFHSLSSPPPRSIQFSPPFALVALLALY